MRKNTLWMNTSNTSEVIGHLSLKAMVKLVCSLRTEKEIFKWWENASCYAMLCYAMLFYAWKFLYHNMSECKWMNESIQCTLWVSV